MSNEINNPFNFFIKSPKVLIYSLFLYLGAGMIYLGISDHDIIPLLQNYGLAGGGVLIILLGTAIGLDDMKKRQPLDEDSFSSVDERRRQKSLYNQLLTEIAGLKENQNLDIEKLNEIITESKNQNTISQEELYSSFSSYFDGIRLTLENKVDDSDEKASRLLDKGTSYSKLGIVFFILSIITWQVCSVLTGFKEQYIYGIVSCSVLFIFIEFLSAWFLRQYRSYVDTSTYLIKIKSIFDRYMLSYLAINSSSKDISSLNKVLTDDIKWPETYLLKNGDIGFAKEAMEAMTYLAKTLKDEAKSKSEQTTQ